MKKILILGGGFSGIYAAKSLSKFNNKKMDIELISDNNYAQDKHIKVKNFEHLFVLKYNKSKLTTENINSLGLFRSIIVNKEGHIVSFAPPKSIDFDIFSSSGQHPD